MLELSARQHIHLTALWKSPSTSLWLCKCMSHSGNQKILQTVIWGFHHCCSHRSYWSVFSPKQICVYDYSTGFIMILLLLRYCILWWWQTCLRWHHLSAERILYPGEWRESRILPVRAEPLSSYYMLKCVKYNTVWKHNVSNTSACFMK